MRQFRHKAFAKLDKGLPKSAELHVEHLVINDDQAVVDLQIPGRFKPTQKARAWIVGVA
jgi:hypothetical protein